MTALNSLQQNEIEELNEFLRDVLGLEGMDSAAELEQPEVRGRFKIETLDQVNWALRKLAALKAEEAQVKALEKAELDRITSWKNRKLLANQQSVSFFEYLVSEYAAEQRATNPKYKGETTPYGKVGFRKQQPDWKYPKESETAEFLLAAGKTELVKVEKTVANKTEFKKAAAIRRHVFVKAGEVVDVATFGEDGLATGMQYKKYFADNEAAPEVIIDTETGEVAEGVEFLDIAVVVDGAKVVPGVEVMDRPDVIDVKPEI